MWCWDLGREWTTLGSGKGVGHVGIWEGSGPPWDVGREWAALGSGKGVDRLEIWEGSGPRWDLGREWAALGPGKGVGRGKVLVGFLGPQWNKGGCVVREAITS